MYQGTAIIFPSHYFTVGNPPPVFYIDSNPFIRTMIIFRDLEHDPRLMIGFFAFYFTQECKTLKILPRGILV